MLLITLTFGLALLLSLYSVPMARRAALQFNVVDRPDGRLKHQAEPVPYFGGLAVYVAFLISLALTFDFRQEVLGLVLGGPLAVMLAALAGSLLGFLRYNFYPASIYLGDTGSLFLGLMLGALAMIGKYTTVNPVAILAPFFILAVPVFDTLFVMYIRRLRRVPVFLGSSDHFALRLRQWALSVPQVVMVSYGAAFVLGGVGLLLMMVSSETALALVGTTVTLAVVTAVWLKRINMSKSSEKIRQRRPAAESARSTR